LNFSLYHYIQILIRRVRLPFPFFFFRVLFFRVFFRCWRVLLLRLFLFRRVRLPPDGVTERARLIVAVEGFFLSPSSSIGE
jgi:hypothetical protein